MAIDDSFVKPGAVPFKWEIRPGVPKPVNHHHKPPSNERKSSLKPPPASPTSFHFPSSPRTQSSRFQFDSKRSIMGRPEVVSTLGCFPTTRNKGDSQRKTNKLHVDPVYKSDLETLSHWSMSTRKSPSPFYDSPSSSSFSSYRSSPRVVTDVEWAGYGLF
uniref:uncharacterized protein LOC122586361 n=1 Tax=Erigeron canadensis TaxID=72917 RepID=UPI001CB8E653|nr:uncharacterized protein LOC122586361 [Erigeron canadensis]